MITIHGEIRDMRLRRSVRVEVDDERTRQTATEYYLGTELVKRDVHIHLKQGLGVEGLLGKF